MNLILSGRNTYRCCELVDDGLDPEVCVALRVDEEGLRHDLVAFIDGRHLLVLADALETDEMWSGLKVVRLETLDDPARHGAGDTFDGF
jgi:hypothetical protein